ncbi:MAG: thioredoxin family protein [Acidimicrobiia bacterium]
MDTEERGTALVVSRLEDGFLAVVRAGCPTCEMVVPALAEIARSGLSLVVVSQDDPGFPEGLSSVDDRGLDVSLDLAVDVVPTLIRFEAGKAVDRTEGWARPRWEALTGLDGIGEGLPEHRPGCGSLTADPVIAERLALRRSKFRSRRVELALVEDEAEACFERGWTDGLPVVAPTEARLARMLEGTRRDPGDVVAVAPPDLVECTVEKVALNAVMAGCRPDYLPVVMAAVEAACTDAFNIHGLLATTHFAGPAVVVNGPITRAIGMNSGVNALGQGNRANATIGRALQLVIRNVGGGRPGEVDRATLGTPAKYSFCFAEDEAGSSWEPLSVERGLSEGTSAVTLFAGEAPRAVVDQLSRTPESLARSFAWCLGTVGHPKLALTFDAVVVVSPEHGRVFREAGWSKRRLRQELAALLERPVDEMVRGAGGCAEGMPPGGGSIFQGVGAGAASRKGEARAPAGTVSKFAPDGLWFVRAGGAAGLFSAIVGGWVRGTVGSQMVTREVVL